MTQTPLLSKSTPMYFLLLSLLSRTQGHQIRKSIEELSGGTLRLGAATIYVLLAQCESEFLIKCISNVDGKKEYITTGEGRVLLQKELDRLQFLYTTGTNLLNGTL